MTKEQIRATTNIITHALILSNEINQIKTMLETMHASPMEELNLRLHNPQNKKNGNIIEFQKVRLPQEGVQIEMTPELFQVLEAQLTEQYAQKTEELKMLRLS